MLVGLYVQGYTSPYLYDMIGKKTGQNDTVVHSKKWEVLFFCIFSIFKTS